MLDEMMEQRLLAGAARQMRYPPTPDLQRGVRDAIVAMPAQRRVVLRPRVGAFALAVALVAIAGSMLVALALPGSRSAIADFFGIEGERIERLPTPAAGTTATPFPTPAGIEQFATPVTIDAASAEIGFAPALAGGEAPDGVYVLDYGAAVVVLQYENFDLWESQAVGLFEKGLPASSVLREFTIKGNNAAWISGGNHIIEYVDGQGRPVAGSQRTVDRNTLVWSTAFANYRIETDLPEAEAIAVAESLP